MRNMELVKNLLNEDNLQDYKKGKELCSNIGFMFNCFGNYKNMAKELFESLTKTGQSKFYLFTCMSALELAENWMINDLNDWDDRKKASEKFAYQNLEFFHELLQQHIGFPITIHDMTTVKANHSLIKQSEFSSCTFLLGFFDKWKNEHSTIKQSIFGGILNGVLIKNFQDSFAATGSSGIYFPFI